MQIWSKVLRGIRNIKIFVRTIFRNSRISKQTNALGKELNKHISAKQIYEESHWTTPRKFIRWNIRSYPISFSKFETTICRSSKIHRSEGIQVHKFSQWPFVPSEETTSKQPRHLTLLVFSFVSTSEVLPRRTSCKLFFPAIIVFHSVRCGGILRTGRVTSHSTGSNE